MGYALFPLHIGGGNIDVDCGKVVAIKESGASDGTGAATLYLEDGPMWQCAENASTVYGRVAANYPSPGTACAIFPLWNNPGRVLVVPGKVLTLQESPPPDGIVGDGRSEIWLGVTSFQLAETSGAVAARIGAALAAPPGTLIGP